MIKKEKARAAAGTAERGMEKPFVRETFTDSDDITSEKEKQARFFIAKLLPQGEANAITTRELLHRTGYRSARELQKEISEERRQGVPILSKVNDGGGYYLPSDGAAGIEEIHAFERTIRARAANTFAALRAARETRKEMERRRNDG